MLLHHAACCVGDRCQNYGVIGWLHIASALCQSNKVLEWTRNENIDRNRKQSIFRRNRINNRRLTRCTNTHHTAQTYAKTTWRRKSEHVRFISKSAMNVRAFVCVLSGIHAPIPLSNISIQLCCCLCACVKAVHAGFLNYAEPAHIDDKHRYDNIRGVCARARVPISNVIIPMIFAHGDDSLLTKCPPTGWWMRYIVYTHIFGNCVTCGPKRNN